MVKHFRAFTTGGSMERMHLPLPSFIPSNHKFFQKKLDNAVTEIGRKTNHPLEVLAIGLNLEKTR